VFRTDFQMAGNPWDSWTNYTMWRRTKTCSLPVREMHLLHGACGVSDEIGELVEVMKNQSERGVIDKVSLSGIFKEIGDIFFYLDLVVDSVSSFWFFWDLPDDQHMRHSLTIDSKFIDSIEPFENEDLLLESMINTIIASSKILGIAKKSAFYSVQANGSVILDHCVSIRWVFLRYLKSIWREHGELISSEFGNLNFVSTILKLNHDKLEHRYKDGFTPGGGNRTGVGE